MNAPNHGGLFTNRRLVDIPSGRMSNGNQGNNDLAKQYPHQHLTVTDQVNAAPTCFDVINGRGKNVHFHPGNQKYRSLVHLNKSLYAICLRSDKGKISKGIVAAIREFGGGFVELDERTGIYHEIGDKKAWAKTSQALREGQTKIRQKIYREEEGRSNSDITMVSSTHDCRSPAVPVEDYFGHSLKILESLYKSEETALPHIHHNNDTMVQCYLPNESGVFNDALETSQADTNSLGLLANSCAV